MAKDDDVFPKPGEPWVECEYCLKAIPESAAFVPEGEDYVAHFCGIECYRQFQLKRQKQESGK